MAKLLVTRLQRVVEVYTAPRKTGPKSTERRALARPSLAYDDGLRRPPQ